MRRYEILTPYKAQMINVGLVLRSAENQAEFLRNRNQKPSEPSENMYVSTCSVWLFTVSETKFFCIILIVCI